MTFLKHLVSLAALLLCIALIVLFINHSTIALPRDWSSSFSSIGSILSGVGTLILSIVSIFALDSWKKEHIGKAKYELEKELKSCILKLHHDIKLSVLKMIEIRAFRLALSEEQLSSSIFPYMSESQNRLLCSQVNNFIDSIDQSSNRIDDLLFQCELEFSRPEDFEKGSELYEFHRDIRAHLIMCRNKLELSIAWDQGADIPKPFFEQALKEIDGLFQNEEIFPSGKLAQGMVSSSLLDTSDRLKKMYTRKVIKHFSND